DAAGVDVQLRQLAGVAGPRAIELGGKLRVVAGPPHAMQPDQQRPRSAILALGVRPDPRILLARVVELEVDARVEEVVSHPTPPSSRTSRRARCACGSDRQR